MPRRTSPPRRVYDVLGQLFEQKPLRDLLIEAIRYGEQPEVKAHVLQVVDDAAGHAHLLDLLERRALTQETFPFSRVQAIREQMEREDDKDAKFWIRLRTLARRPRVCFDHFDGRAPAYRHRIRR